ncbi:MAG: ABC transporter permease [Acidiferrobacterales bacterium]
MADSVERNWSARMLRLSLQALRRDWRSGDLKVLALAIAIAVASMTSVGFFTDRVHRAMESQASELLGADLVVISPQPIDQRFVQHARQLHLAETVTLTFPSVALVADKMELLEVKAVADGYPLRGTLRVAEKPYGTESRTHSIPERGTVWLDPRALTRLGLRVGGRLMLGASDLTVATVLSYEPDRGGDLFSIAPRLLMNLNDVPNTQLIGPGSRVTYHLLIAGAPDALSEYRRWLQTRLHPGERLQDVRDARPELRDALDRAEKFLGLAALVSVVLAGVAIATATRRYAARHLDATAVMRCLGATQSFILRLHVLQMLWLGLAASVAGCVAGYVAQEVLAYLLSGIVSASLPEPSALPLVVGVFTGLAVLFGFGLPPVLRLKDVPPARVLRRDLSQMPAGSASVYGAAVAVITALMFWQAHDLRLTFYLLAGTAGTLAVLAIMAYAMVRALDTMRSRVGVAWRFGLANIARRAGASVAQVVTFGIGIMVLLLLSLVRGDLLSAWERSLPAGAPNQFIINVQPDQVRALQQFFADNGLAHTVLYPMVRGRLLAIDGRPADAAKYKDERARRLVEREFNLSWAAQPQRDNRIVAGKWWTRSQYGTPLVSVEKGLADTLGIRLGDTLSYRIADRDITVRVANLRTVEWDSFRVNFFVVAPPGVLDGYPATYITSFHLAPAQHGLLGRLVRRFPNLTVIDVQAIMSKVRSIMQRVNLSIEYVFLFTLFAGFTVLYAAIQTTQDERLYEVALLRTLGASRRQLLQGLAAEFIALGVLAGILAALAATISGYAMAREIFHLDFSFDPWLWLTGLIAGGAGVGVFGLWGTRFVLRRPPLQTLRQFP